MTKTAALKAAQAAISMPQGKATSWMIVAPFNAGAVEGPRTEHHYTSHSEAMRDRTTRVVLLALALMGHHDKGYAFQHALDDLSAEPSYNARDALTAMLPAS